MTQPTDFYARYLEALARKAELGARFLNALVSFLRNSAMESLSFWPERSLYAA